MKKNQETLVHEDGRFFLFIGGVHDPSATRVDVTMAVKIGMRIGAQDYSDVQLVTA